VASIALNPTGAASSSRGSGDNYLAQSFSVSSAGLKALYVELAGRAVLMSEIAASSLLFCLIEPEAASLKQPR
jgi:hypothetical protein